MVDCGSGVDFALPSWTPYAQVVDCEMRALDMGTFNLDLEYIASDCYPNGKIIELFGYRTISVCHTKSDIETVAMIAITAEASAAINRYWFRCLLCLSCLLRSGREQLLTFRCAAAWCSWMKGTKAVLSPRFSVAFSSRKACGWYWMAGTHRTRTRRGFVRTA